MEPKNKSKLPVLTMLLVALLVLVGTSYAYFDYSFIGKDNTISTTDVSIKLLESNKEIVTLENQLPMSDEQGINQVGTGNVFDFAVETKSSSDMKLGYKLNIEKLKADTGYTSLTDDQIKIYLTDTNDNKILGPLKISDLENYNLYEDVNIHSKTNNTQVDKYRIRVWIDQDVQIKDWDENTKQQYKFKIGVGSAENEGSYIITYSPNGGTGTMAASIYNKNTTNTLRKNTFTRGGYTFKGWSTTNNGEVEYQDQNTATNLTQNQNDQNKTLYAVWKPNTYTVKYHPNGGTLVQTIEPDVNYDPVNMGTNNTKWTKEGNVYKSGNLSTSNRTYLLHSITLEEAGTLSFEVAVSQSENYEIMFVLFPPDFSNPIEQKSIKATPGITKEDDLVYQKIEIPLEAGSYGIGFGPFETPSESEGLDRAYVKNIKIPGYVEGQLEDSTFTVGQNNKLQTNKYIKTGYAFKGWNTNKNETKTKYQDESDLTNLESKVKEQDQIDLYAIWEINKYTVNVVAQNGTINGDSTKQIEYNKNGVFNLTSSIDSNSGKVTCTNGQSGILENGVLTIKNVSSDTTCTAKFIDSVTTLYRDGTLIINEKPKNRSANISTHGVVAKEYDAMSNSNSYVFTKQCIPDKGCTSDALWFQEQTHILNVEIGSNIKPISTANWFLGLSNMKKGDFINLDTSSVTDMRSMFDGTGKNAKTFELKGLGNWDVSKVTNMESMFYDAGYQSTTWSIGDLSNWNTLSVTNMISMFYEAGGNDTTFNLNLSNWNTSSVTDMSSMFYEAGSGATTWSIGDLSNWDVSNVTNMSSMFHGVGYSDTTFNLNLSGWNVSKVTDMSSMFDDTGRNATTFELKGLGNWDVSKVTDMHYMFSSAGYSATTFNIGDLSNWSTSSVTDMGCMFCAAGYSTPTFNLNLSNWNTSSATDMSSMFHGAGYSATTFSLNLSNWDVSKVTDMNHMFFEAGYSATTFELKGLESWDVSKVTDMYYMFSGTGYKSQTFNLNLSNWNTSSVTSMRYMFYSAGAKATTWSVTIPKTTGSLTNTTSRWYGSSSSTYTSPDTGKSFTLAS